MEVIIGGYALLTVAFVLSWWAAWLSFSEQGLQADDGSFVVSCVDRSIEVLSVGVSILLMERWLREEKRRKEEEVRIEKNFGSLNSEAIGCTWSNAIANSVETVALDLFPFKTPSRFEERYEYRNFKDPFYLGVAVSGLLWKSSHNLREFDEKSHASDLTVFFKNL